MDKIALFKRSELLVLESSKTLQQIFHVRSAQQVHENVVQRLVKRCQTHVYPSGVTVNSRFDCHAASIRFH